MANYNLFDAASLAMVPTGVKDGKLYSVKPDDGSGDFTFSRGTNLAATRVNADGLIEKGRENLLLQSNSFDTTWTLDSGMTLTSGQSGYDGSSDAWLLERNVAFDYLRQDSTNSGVQTYSVYAKAGTLDWIFLRFQDTGGYNGKYFDLANGEVGSTDGTIIDANIEQVGATDWYRCDVTINATLQKVWIYPVPNDNGVGASGSGNIYIQDAQLERGLVATDYIETTTAPVQAGITEDLPRIDYTDGCGSLLLEPSRTNGVLQSEYFGSGWLLSNATITTNDTTSPEGVINAAKIVENSSTANHYIAEDVSTTSGVPYTMSFFAKKGENRYIRASRAGGSVAVGFDLENGDFVEGGGAIGNTQDFGNGWYRCIMTFDTNTTTTQIRIELSNALSATNTTYLGDSTSGVYVYGAQLEAGSYPTSYIPTYGSSVTRNIDVATSDITSILTSNEGTLFIHLNNDANSGGYGSGALSIGLQNNTGSNFVGWASNSPASTELRAIYKVNGTTYYMGSSTPINTECKILVRWGNGYASFFKDGILFNQQSTANFTGQPLIDFLLPNQFRTGNFPIKESYVFPTALTDNECLALTRPYDTYQEWVDGEGLTWESKSCTTQNIIELQNL